MRKFFQLLIMMPLLLQGATIARQKSDAAPEIPTLTHCDLVSKSPEYDKKDVRIRTVYFTGFEASIFRDPRCEDKSIWVDFMPSVVLGTDPKIYKKFLSLTDARAKRTPDGGIDYPYRSVEVLVVGRFEGVRETRNPDGTTSRRGYGHLNGYDYLFTVARIEDVKALPEKKP